MKYLLISICLLFLSYGCSKDAPTATEPELDTTTRGSADTYTIQFWDSDKYNWIDTDALLDASWEWRFISYTKINSSRVRINGGYTLYLSNSSDYNVDYKFDRLTFEDSQSIPLYTIEPFIDPTCSSCSNKWLPVRANGGTAEYADTFEIELDNIAMSNQITAMRIWPYQVSIDD